MPGNYSRYVYDTLYGRVQLDDWPWGSEIDNEFWKIFTCPELQRLREVRLCNINSLFLPGGANIDRFEHALGTYYLAKECLKTWPALNKITPNEKKLFLVAALLHDFKTSAFGHSVQYIEEKEGFRHEGDFFTAIKPGITEPIESDTESHDESSYQYNLASTDPIYFGRGAEIKMLLTNEELKKVGKLIEGKGKLGPLISSDMDLDNIDNVFRLAYHIGITDDCETPLKLARELHVENGKKIISEEAVPLIKKWREVRNDLYEYLLLNPGEFSAKCMLTESIAFAKRQDYHLTWDKVDRELIDSLKNRPNYRKEDLRIYQFAIDAKQDLEFEEGEELPTWLVMALQEQGVNLSENPIVQKVGENWAINENNPRYILKNRGKQIKVYREGVESYSIHDTISRLMRGELYGCLSILSITGSNLESLDEVYSVFDDIDIRLELGRELSAKLPGELWNRRILTRFHAIRDVNKTRRPVHVQVKNGKRIEIGESSQQILIGVFAANNNLNIYDVDKISSEGHSKLEQKIVEFVEGVINRTDSKLRVMPLELYSESKNE